MSKDLPTCPVCEKRKVAVTDPGCAPAVVEELCEECMTDLDPRAYGECYEAGE